MARVIVIGGGSAGCGAAVGAVKAGAETILVERTDLLLGCALVCRWMRNAGRFVLCEEGSALGGNELIGAFDSLRIPKSDEIRDKRFSSFPEKHAQKMSVGYLFDTGRAEPTIRQLLKDMGVEIRFESRATDVKKEGNRITAVKLARGGWLEGDAFVDSTGTAGGMANCKRYGAGCVMCPMFRCPTFGDRVSIAAKAGVAEMTKRKRDGTPGIMLYGVGIYLGSLSPELQQTLNEDGITTVKARGAFDPREYETAYNMWGRHGYNPATGEPIDAETSFANPYTWADLVMPLLPSTGIACPSGGQNFPYISYEKLRRIPGFEHAILVWPQGGKGNFMSGFSITERENSLRAVGVENLFVAGEKLGVMGMGEGMCTGFLAGHNAVRTALGKKLLVLPRTTVTGELIAWSGEKNKTKEAETTWYDSHGGLFLSRIMKLGLWTTNANQIRAWIEAAGLTNIYSRKIV